MLPATKKTIQFLIMAVVFIPLPVIGADIIYNGDGSATNNPNLLRGSYETGCYYPAICGGLLVEGQNNINSPTNNSAGQANINVPIVRNRPNIAPQPAKNLQNFVTEKHIMPIYQLEPVAPANIELDWGFSLRGAYEKNYNGEGFTLNLEPNIRLTQQNERSQYDLGLDANLVKTIGGDYRLAGLGADFNGSYALNKQTNINLASNISVRQEDVNSLGAPNNIVVPPHILKFNLNAGLEKKFGKLSTNLRLGYSRDYYSFTGLNNNQWQDNSAKNRNGFSADLRLAREITPIFGAYSEFAVQRNIFDNISQTGLRVSQNNWVYSARAGISGNWNNLILADISAGYLLYQFDNNSLTANPTFIFAANLTYENNNGLNIGASLASNISTADPTSGASLKKSYNLKASASYLINDWLKIRANASGNWANYVGIADIERNYQIGAGLDYKLNKNITLSGDYSYNLANNSTTAQYDGHKFELGLTYKR